MLLNAAPPCALVVPEPLCVPPENADAPVAVSVPLPLKSPPDRVSESLRSAFDGLCLAPPRLMLRRVAKARYRAGKRPVPR